MLASAGVESMMGLDLELFYHRAKGGNFGDDLNTWLWDSILPGWREARPGTVLVGVGTLINDRLPRGRPKLVLGTGVGYGELPDAEMLSECRFLSVRGPRSAAALGLPASAGIVDPAVMIGDLDAFRGIPKSGPPVFVPHHHTIRQMDWEAICNRIGIAYLPPTGEAHEVIRRLAAAPLVIAESMHAAILADALGTPWHAASFSYLFNEWKWRDWAESIGAPLEIEVLDPLGEFLSRKKAAKPAGAAKPAPQPVAPQPVAAQPAAAQPAAETQPAAEPAEPGAAKRSLSFRLRTTAARPFVITRMKSLARQEGHLSPRDRLEDAKARYRRVLAQALEEGAS